MKKSCRSFAVLAAAIFTMTCGVKPVHATEIPVDVAGDVLVIAEADAVIAEYEAKAAIQREATQAYAALSETFGVAEDGATIYPDDYAGAWIEGSILHVALTSLDSHVTANYDNLFSSFSCIVYEAAEHSLNELHVIQNAVFDAINGIYDVTAYYTEVNTNKIVFEVMDHVETVQSWFARTFSTRSFSAE
ncbi:MAG: hypothetical protein LBQ15_11520 [Clostridium sp.]|nr:hypothetical protein [Clostridium sp.]